MQGKNVSFFFFPPSRIRRLRHENRKKEKKKKTPYIHGRTSERERNAQVVYLVTSLSVPIAIASSSGGDPHLHFYYSIGYLRGWKIIYIYLIVYKTADHIGQVYIYLQLFTYSYIIVGFLFFFFLIVLRCSGVYHNERGPTTSNSIHYA